MAFVQPIGERPVLCHVSPVRAIVSAVAPVVPHRQLRLEAEFPVSIEVVWDALVDPVLAEGWLGELSVDPLPEGQYSLRFRDAPLEEADWNGTIRAVSPPGTSAPGDPAPAVFLEVSFAPHLLVRFELTSGAHRSTLLVLRHSSFLDDSAALAAEGFWHRRLGYLVELLRGHPAEWASEGPVHRDLRS
jgi:uncharacterized protein YndB with AHSA1/START domain